MGKKNRMRFAARNLFNQRLNTLITKCYWCSRPIIWKFKLKEPTLPNEEVVLLGGRFTLPRGTVDHVIPLCDGGTNDHNNLVGSCFGCNTRKEDWSKERFTEYTNRFFEGAGLR